MAQKNVRLRLEGTGGTATQEYRVDEGRVEVRMHSGAEYDPPENRWQQLTPRQLRAHVERNTVVAQWLERRLGWRRLLQACVSQEPHDWTRVVEDYDEKRAA